VRAKEYYMDAQIVEHIFASFKSCKDLKPLLGGAIFKSGLKKTHDIHLYRFGYKAKYLKQFINTSAGPKPHCQVCDIPFLNPDACF